MKMIGVEGSRVTGVQHPYLTIWPYGDGDGEALVRGCLEIIIRLCLRSRGMETWCVGARRLDATTSVSVGR